MSILKKPYEISLWEDVWDEAKNCFIEKRALIIGSDIMNYPGRALQPTLVRKTNGEITFSFKMYYQFVDTTTGERVDNPFVNYIANESKIKLKYDNEWFDLLVKKIDKDSASLSLTYQLVNQHVTELSKNGFDITLDSTLMNNLGTTDELGNKILENTDWHVESEKVVATEEEGLVMMNLPSSLAGYHIYRIDDGDLSSQGAIGVPLTEAELSLMTGKPIYAFYSACSGSKPYRFQFIYKDPENRSEPYSDLFFKTSDRVITDQQTQYYIDGLTEWETSSGFTTPKDFTISVVRETALGNSTAISLLYRGKRYVYTQISEYHAGLDMYLQRFSGPIKKAYWSRGTDKTNWDKQSKIGYQSSTYQYYANGKEPSADDRYSVGDIIEIHHNSLPSYYVVVTDPYGSKNHKGRYSATTVTGDYYKYTKTEYVTPNLIQNIVSNAEFSSTSGWRGGKFCNDTTSATPDAAKQINTYLRAYNFNSNWARYIQDGYVGHWDTTGYKGKNDHIEVGDYAYIDGVIKDWNDQPIRILVRVDDVTYKDVAPKKGYVVTYPHIKTTTVGSSYSTMGTEITNEAIRYANNIIHTATEDMYNGSWQAETNYSPCLMCSNMSDQTDNLKVITNSGPYDMRTSIDGFVEGETYIVEMDFYRALLNEDQKSYTIQSSLRNNNGKAQIKIRLANFALLADRKGYALEQQGHNDTFTRSNNGQGRNDDYDNNGIDDRVLFYARGKQTTNPVNGYGHIVENGGLLSFSQEVQIKGSLSKEEFIKDNYKLFIEFRNAGASDYYFITKLRVYKKISKADGGYYSPDSPIDEDNISYKTEDKYFAVVDQDSRKVEDITFSSANSTAFIPILSASGIKKDTINVKESNYFNGIQTIAETFKCWPKFEVNHDDDGNIVNFENKEYSKRVSFKNYIGRENLVGFKYGINSKDIKRTLDSNQIVSKLIVKANSNQYAPNGFCSIARASTNHTKDNVIYNFDHYINQGQLDALMLQKDLYSAENSDLMRLVNADTKLGPKGALYVTEKIGEHNIDQYLTSCTGYYSKIQLINARLEELSTNISKYSTPLSQAIADYNTYKAMLDSAIVELDDAHADFYNLAGFYVEDVGIDDRTEDEKNPNSKNYRKSNAETVQDSTTLKNYFSKVVEFNNQKQTAERELAKAVEQKTACESALVTLETQYDNALFLKNWLNKLFYTRYSRFIQEGTWIDESYIDESLYYNDAMSVSYNSALPKVTYTINVLSLAGVPDYELFDFKVGDQTFVEDVEFFGYEEDGITPYKAKITITETSENLDEPNKNVIKVQNYENQFKDLFQRITATVQSVQYTEGSYKKAAALAEADAAHKIQFLSGALSDAANVLSNDGAQNWTLDQNGLTLESLITHKKLRAVGGAILLGQPDDNGVDRWKTGITADGISASILTTGILNTGEINIMNGDEPTFRWDSHGITAYDFVANDDNSLISGMNRRKGVRFDRFGIYGYRFADNSELTGENWRPTGIDTGSAPIEDHSTFYLTWAGLKVTKHSNDGTPTATVRIGDNAQDDSDTDVFKISKYVYDGDVRKEQKQMWITSDGDIRWNQEASPTNIVYNDEQAPKLSDDTIYLVIPDNKTDSYNGWHKIKSANDRYGSYTYDGGVTWTNPIQIEGQDGKDGRDGKDGTDAEVNYSNMWGAFYAAATDPNGDQVKGLVPFREGNKQYLGINADLIQTGALRVGPALSEGEDPKTNAVFYADIGGTNGVKIGNWNVGSIGSGWWNGEAISEYPGSLYGFNSDKTSLVFLRHTTGGHVFGVRQKDGENGYKNIFSISNTGDVVMNGNINLGGNITWGKNNPNPTFSNPADVPRVETYTREYPWHKGTSDSYWKRYIQVGYQGQWNLKSSVNGESTANHENNTKLKIGDIVYILGKITDAGNEEIRIYGVVTGAITDGKLPVRTTSYETNYVDYDGLCSSLKSGDGIYYDASSQKIAINASLIKTGILNFGSDGTYYIDPFNGKKQNTYVKLPNFTVTTTGVTVTGTINATGGELGNLTLKGALTSDYLVINPLARNSTKVDEYALEAGPSISKNSYMYVAVNIPYAMAGPSTQCEYTAPSGWWITGSSGHAGWTATIVNNTTIKFTSETGTSITKEGILTATLKMQALAMRGRPLRVNKQGSIIMPLWDGEKFEDADLGLKMEKLLEDVSRLKSRVSTLEFKVSTLESYHSK